MCYTLDMNYCYVLVENSFCNFAESKSVWQNSWAESCCSCVFLLTTVVQAFRNFTGKEVRSKIVWFMVKIVESRQFCLLVLVDTCHGWCFILVCVLVYVKVKDPEVKYSILLSYRLTTENNNETSISQVWHCDLFVSTLIW